MSDTACVIVALVINSSSYVAEVIRAGIQAEDKGQMEAAKSLGLYNKNAMRYVIPVSYTHLDVYKRQCSCIRCPWSDHHWNECVYCDFDGKSGLSLRDLD